MGELKTPLLGVSRGLAGLLQCRQFFPPTGVSSDLIVQIANDFSHSEHAMAIGGGSPAAHTNGLENMKAVFSL
ncbi:MAG: hypothetical protein CM1200mP3_02610 [Chloroflexota bacterium]|nr:MAG: hypothetical protein CM1200mP3_02610 [Chloroflexota bacterium]